MPKFATLRVPINVLAWTALFVNLIIILQGAVVRATGSGAGCGSHWPLCNGEIVPLAPSLETMIEFSHRLLSLGALILGAISAHRGVAVAQKRGLTCGAQLLLRFVFLIFEALLGAATVLLGLTAENTSIARGVMVASHLVNSLLLVGALTATVVYARDRTLGAPRVRDQGMLATVLGVGLVGMLILTFSGGIAAMGNTMFPSSSLAQGLAADFSASSHLFIRLRILHPLIAITVGIYLFLSLGLSWWLKPVYKAKRLAQALFGVYVVQLLIGSANLAFLAPTVLQLLHLLTAVLAFGLLVAISVYALGSPAIAIHPSLTAHRPDQARDEGSVK